MKVENIPLSRIRISPLNPRKTFDESELRDLADNIEQQGLLQPITVRPVDYLINADGSTCDLEIVCGERRYRAVKMIAGKSKASNQTIACIIREMTDEEALDAMITENLQRKDVDPIEEAFAFGQLHANGKSIEELSLRFGKSKRFIQERIKLNELLPELKKCVTSGEMHIGAAMHICKLTEDEQRKFFEETFDEGEDNDEDSEPVTKQDAIRFTRELFMQIDNADWNKDFEGYCCTTCANCPFNNANVGCLFYEMKPHDATCTRRERWNAKRHSWLLKMIADNSGVLVREGEDLEAGKTVVVKDTAEYYLNRCKDFQPLLEEIAGMGYRIVDVDDFFMRYSSYSENDERLKEKVRNNEVYRCLTVETTYRGTEVSIRYYTFKKDINEGTSDEIKAMDLVNVYKENQRKSITALASKLRGVLGDMEPTELSTEPLSQTESLVLMTLILRKCSYKYRTKLNIASTYSPDPQVLDYAKAHTEQVHQICRDFLREELSSSGVEYNPDLQVCQSMLLQEWAKEQAEEISSDNALRLAKKQSKIKEQLTALGYNTDGTKMEF